MFFLGNLLLSWTSLVHSVRASLTVTCFGHRYRRNRRIGTERRKKKFCVELTVAMQGERSYRGRQKVYCLLEVKKSLLSPWTSSRQRIQGNNKFFFSENQIAICQCLCPAFLGGAEALANRHLSLCKDTHFHMAFVVLWLTPNLT